MPSWFARIRKAVATLLWLALPSLAQPVQPPVVSDAAPGLPATPSSVVPPSTTPTPPPDSTPPPRTTELIDYDDAFVRLGARMPDGSTIAVGLVEGHPGEYAPDPNRPDLVGIDVVPRSGRSVPFGHATGTASTLTGKRGVAPRVKQLACWSTPHWLTHGYLNLGTPRPPAHRADSPRVFSHSWVAFDEARAVPVLRRVDWAIDQFDVVMCVGVNNGKDKPVPPSLGPAYNAIAVGVDTGNSSGGGTTVDTPGRAKPDLVAPGNMTSFSTPAVAGCAVLLLQWADGMVIDGHVHANRAETIKAVLMAGATKHHAWAKAPGRPLDEHLGAGRVNLDNALRILEGGNIAPGQRIKRSKAWAFDTLAPGATDRWTLEPGGDLGEVSVILTWHRRITGKPIALSDRTSGPRHALWYNAPRLADLDLRLVRIDEVGNAVSTVAESTSRIDNVEHLYLKSLSAGRYALEVFRDQAVDPITDETWEYAIAWRVEAKTD